MLMTPPRPESQARRQLAETPPKVRTRGPQSAPASLAIPHGETARALMAKATSAQPSPAVDANVAAVPDGVSAERNAIVALFAAMELTIPMQASRKRRVELGSLREDVQQVTDKGLSDPRLAAILELSNGMVCGRWVGSGFSAVFEIYQRDEDGQIRSIAPTERANRKQRFEEALDADIAKNGSLREFSFPPRPSGPPKIELKTTEALVKRHEAPSEVIPKLASLAAQSGPIKTAAERRAALFSHLRAKEAAKARAENSEYAKLRAKLHACEDAMVMHSFVSGFFSRGEGAAASTTYAEVIQAACGMSLAKQSLRVLESAEARVGLDHLIEMARGWFSVEQGKFNDDMYIRRVPGASSGAALRALEVERQDLVDQMGTADRFGDAAATQIVAAVCTPSAQANACPGKASTPTLRDVAQQRADGEPRDAVICSAADKPERRASSVPAPLARAVPCTRSATAPTRFLDEGTAELSTPPIRRADARPGSSHSLPSQRTTESPASKRRKCEDGSTVPKRVHNCSAAHIAAKCVTPDKFVAQEPTRKRLSKKQPKC